MNEAKLTPEQEKELEILKGKLLNARSNYEVEKTFVEESMPDGLQGLTKTDMIKYIQYVTDIVLNDFGCELEFNVRNPLEYMSRIGLSSKNNFSFSDNESLPYVNILSKMWSFVKCFCLYWKKSYSISMYN